MGVISAAVKHLIAAGITGDALVRAIEDMESQQIGEYRRDLGMSATDWQELRLQVFDRDGYRCRYCGSDVTSRPQCDHVVPLISGGLSEVDNLATSCKRCNSSKSGKSLSEWRAPSCQ